MKVLLTGASGFVGPYVLRALSENGHQVFPTSPSGGSSGQALSGPADESFRQVLRMNVLEPPTIRDAMQIAEPDVVIHLAGQSSVKKSWDDPKETMRINVDGTRNLLTAIQRVGRNCHCLMVSSAEIFGTPTHLPLTEESPVHPENPYAESRKAQEALVKEFPDLRLTVVRSFNHTGPGQTPQFVVPQLVRSFARIQLGIDPPLIRLGNPSIRRDFLDVRDAADAYVRLIASVPAQRLYLVCSGKSILIQDVVDQLSNLTNLKVQIQIDRSLFRQRDIPELLGSHARLSADTGWRPSRDFLDHTLPDMLNYWRSQESKTIKST